MQRHLESLGLSINPLALGAKQGAVAVARLLTAEGNPGVNALVGENGLHVGKRAPRQ